MPQIESAFHFDEKVMMKDMNKPHDLYIFELIVIVQNREVLYKSE